VQPTEYDNYFNCGVDYIPDVETGHKHHLAVEMIFDRFDPENSTRLVFTEGETRLPCDGKQSEKYKRAYMRKKYRAWRQNIIYYLCEEGDDAGDSQFDSPPRVICVGDPVNDTELPGLSVDYETKKISFE